MDDRLKQVQTTDLTDSRLNHEFVAWLKTSGMNYLLMLLLIACAFLSWDWWNRRQDEARDAAWTELSAATSPAAFRGVAETHAEVDAIAELAMLTAGDLLLNSVKTGLRPGLTATDEGAQLSDEEKAESLTEADAFFARAAELAGSRSGFAGKPVILASLFGRAAVAESQDRIDDARKYLEEAATVAAPEYAPMAEQAQARIDNLEGLSMYAQLPAQAQLPVAAPAAGDAYTVPAADNLLEMFDDEAEAGPSPNAETPATSDAPAEAPAETPATADAPAEAPAETPATADAPAEAPAETPATADAPAEAPAETPATSDAPAEAPAETPATSDAPAEAPAETPATSDAPAEAPAAS